MFAHESTLVWDGKTGELLQKIAHEGGLRFKIALSCDFVALALEARDKVRFDLIKPFNITFTETRNNGTWHLQIKFKITFKISLIVLQVIVYKPCPATNSLLEFAKFDVAKLVPGCDIILDAQVQIVR